VGSSPPGTARSLLKKLGEAKNCKAHVQHTCNDAAWLMDWPCTHWPGLWGLKPLGTFQWDLACTPCMSGQSRLLTRGYSTCEFTPGYVHIHNLVVNLPESTLVLAVDTHHGAPNTVRAELANLNSEITRPALSQCNERPPQAMIPKLQCHPASCIAPQKSLVIGD